MSGPGCSPPRRLALALALGTAAVTALAPSASSAPAAVPAAAPLASTWTTTSGSWATVAMGKLGRPNDTFWQLFFRPASGGAWSLVTPPAVADNGGLVVDDGGAATVTAGFEPSQYLKFSPLAQSRDDGTRWSSGVFPGALLDVPDALGSTTAGGLVALGRRSGGTVLASGGSLDRWRTVGTLGSLARSAGRPCGLVALRAVEGTDRGPVVGGACRTPGVVGIFSRTSGTWHASGLRLPGAAGGLATSVLRLGSWGGGTDGLVAAGRGDPATLFAIWQTSPSSWTASPPMPLGRGHLVASGFGPAGAVVALVATPSGGEDAWWDAGPGAGWSRLPAPPPATAAVSIGSGGAADALVVHGKDLTDWQLATAGSGWTRGATLSVPLQYGSST